VTCLAGDAGACTGPLRIVSSAGTPFLVGKARVSVASGSTETLAVSLTKAARSRLAATGRLAVKTTLKVTAGALSATLTSSSSLRT
jgi:hypothetical protein